MQSPPPSDIFTPLVERFLQVQDLTWGSAKTDYLLRYRGLLLNTDSAAAYDELAALLRPMGVTPLFRLEEDQAGQPVHVILLLDGLIQPKPSNPWVNLLLFLLTVVSMLLVGAQYDYRGPLPENVLEMFAVLFANLHLGIPFAASMMSILLAHEFGHYLLARYHKAAVTLPYFIPFPLSPLGTMGAFIQIKEPPRNRRALLDIGLAGPLAGLVVALPILLYGLSQSPVDLLPRALLPGEGISLEGNSLLYLLAKFAVKGELLPAPASYGGLPPFLYWIRYFFTVTPVPFGGRDVLMNSVAWAGWGGLLVTALNLLPAGQLDGGHVLYVLFGRKRATAIWPYILGGLLLLGLVWSGWWMWAMIVFFMGRVYLEPLDQITPLDPIRQALAILGLVLFVLLFTPVPLFAVFGGQ